MTFKIKLEDKAALLNRLEKVGSEISSTQIKDNKMDDSFEITTDSPDQIKTIETILKQSPKINIVKEMKKSLTKSELKEMVRTELQAILAEKKKIKGEDKKENLDEQTTGAEMAAKQLMGAISGGDPFWTGVALVGAVATGILAGPSVIKTLKGYYKALTQKDPAKAEKLKDAAGEANLDLDSGVEA